MNGQSVGSTAYFNHYGESTYGTGDCLCIHAFIQHVSGLSTTFVDDVCGDDIDIEDVAATSFRRLESDAASAGWNSLRHLFSYSDGSSGRDGARCVCCAGCCLQCLFHFCTEHVLLGIRWMQWLLRGGHVARKAKRINTQYLTFIHTFSSSADIYYFQMEIT